MTTQLEQFFKLCDPEDSKSVDRDAFHALCNRFEIAGRDADVIFEDLDSDQDGLISFEDFSRVFSDFLVTPDCSEVDSNPVEADEPSSGPQEAKKDDAIKQNVWSALAAEAQQAEKQKNSEEKSLKWLLTELQSSEKRHLVPFLENAVEDLMSNLKRLQEEKVQLEELWKREKQEHDRHLKRMEEEMDIQVKEAEIKVRLKAQADVDGERKSLQSKMDAEMDNLQVHLALFEKVNSWLQSHPQDNYDNRLDEVKTKLDEAVNENRHLRLSLLDTQTNIALMHSELLQLRALYEEKCRELTSEREKILEVLHEHDHLSRQLNLLHDVNRRLQDTNDILRNSMDQPSKPPRMLESTSCTERNGSVLGDYFDSAYSPIPMYSFPDKEYTDNEEDDRFHSKSNPLRRARSMDITNLSSQIRSRSTDKRTGRRHLNKLETCVCSGRDSQEHDEGFSSTPDSSLVVREEDPSSQDRSPRLRGSRDSSINRDSVHHAIPITIRTESRHSQSSCSANSYVDSREMPKRKISEIIKQLGIQDSPVSFRNRSPKVPKGVEKSSSKEHLQGDLPLNPSVKNVEGGCVVKTDIPDNGADESLVLKEQEAEYSPTGPAERIFKVIFVGDAGVGKSSFAHRISRGVFMKHTSSTLGVDFLTRNIRVDSRNIEVQLWDTAGQEKFRCLTKSYFRNADGVMLLYDCTCESSFLNVRRWADDVDSMTTQKIPMMIIGNKIDLRPNAGSRCITAEEGQRLAQECDAIFIEASAKDGTNVLHALAKLVRCMFLRRELQASVSTMQLCETKPKKSGCCSR